MKRCFFCGQFKCPEYCTEEYKDSERKECIKDLNENHEREAKEREELK